MAIIGTRKCENLLVEKIIEKLPDDCAQIVSGGARGVDSLAEKAAKQLNIPVTIYLPEYEKYGRKAPLVRNIQIIENVDLVLAFWDFSSRGTAYTISQCVYRGVPVQVFGIND